MSILKYLKMCFLDFMQLPDYRNQFNISKLGYINLLHHIELEYQLFKLVSNYLPGERFNFQAKDVLSIFSQISLKLSSRPFCNFQTHLPRKFFSLHIIPSCNVSKIVYNDWIKTQKYAKSMKKNHNIPIWHVNLLKW